MYGVRSRICAVSDPQVLGLQPRPGQFQRPRQGQLGGDLREVVQRQVPHVGVEAPLLCAAAKEREDLANRKRN
jgi:hypothetical protein